MFFTFPLLSPSQFIPPAETRWNPHSPKARISRQVTVPHHHGSHSGRRPLLPGGALHRSPAAEQVTNADPGSFYTASDTLLLSWTRRSLGLTALAAPSLGTLVRCQNVTPITTTIMSVFFVKKMSKLINFRGNKG